MALHATLAVMTELICVPAIDTLPPLTGKSRKSSTQRELVLANGSILELQRIAIQKSLVNFKIAAIAVLDL